MTVTDGKIITLSYIIRNGRGTALEESSNSFLFGSPAISRHLQSQLLGLQAGDRKTVLLPRGMEGADDDFTFEVYIESIRDAAPTELSSGRHLPPVKIHLLSGFLGSGKTTAIEQACRFLAKNNQNTAVITNDQGLRLVDGHRFRYLGMPSLEVSGGCLCCNYNILEENIRSLTVMGRPAMLFAEAVGSCTDMVATVLKPMLDRNPEWQPTISAFADARLIDDASFAPGVQYIYQKQLEEAQVLLITHSENFSPEWQREIKNRFPGKPVLFHNSFQEKDIHRWLQILEALPANPPLPSLNMDYDLYAEGEAHLAWLDEDLTILCTRSDAQDAALALMQLIHKKIKERDYPIGHLKFLLDGKHKISYTAAGTQDHLPAAAHSTTLLINARIQTEPERLAQLVADAKSVIASSHNCDICTQTHKSFSPAYPRPQHRIA